MEQKFSAEVNAKLGGRSMGLEEGRFYPVTVCALPAIDRREHGSDGAGVP